MLNEPWLAAVLGSWVGGRGPRAHHVVEAGGPELGAHGFGHHSPPSSLEGRGDAGVEDRTLVLMDLGSIRSTQP